MDNLTNSLKNYLSGFQDLNNWGHLTSEEKTHAKYKLASYITLAAPLIALIVYAGSLAYDSLFNRVSKNLSKPTAQHAKNTDNIGKAILVPKSAPITQQVNPELTPKILQIVPNSAPQVKKISTRTIYSREKLSQVLADETERAYNHKIVETPDNGDCFYAAFAIGLSEILQQKFTALEMRKIVSDEIKKIHEYEIKKIQEENKRNPDSKEMEMPEHNWVRKYLNSDIGNIDTFEDYLTRIANDYEISQKKYDRAPIWGKEKVDGVILCRHFNVNLHVTEMIPMDDKPESVEEIAIGENTYPPNEEYPKEVKIALYPGHFLGLIPKN